MKIETLVSALEYNFDNFNSQKFEQNVLIVNQSNEETIVDIDEKTRMITSTSRGIGISRKIALENSNSEIVIFADDDEEFVEGYTELVGKYYREFPDADLIFFNVDRFGDDRRKGFKKSKTKRVKWYNSLKYGAVNISAKKVSLDNKKITFDSRFGKTPWVFGEDSIFIFDALRSGLKIYYVEEVIAKVDLSNSTWFEGIDDNYFYAKGAQFYRLSRILYLPLMFQFLVRKRSLYKNEIGFFSAWSKMLKGKNDFKNLDY